MVDKRIIAGIDIGGTNIRCAVADRDQPTQVYARRNAATPPAVEPAALVELIHSQIQLCLNEAGLSGEAPAGIGCAIAGITDAGAGLLISAANLSGWREVPLGALLEERFGVAAALENDVRAAAFGEFKFGAGRNRRSLIYMTISTGVSAGIIVDGRVLRGSHNVAGEIAYMIPEPMHIGREWGLNGCLELTAAGVGIAREWTQRKNQPEAGCSAAEVFARSREGDQDAAEVVERAGDYLIQAAVSLCTVADPEILVLGGGIAENEPELVAKIKRGVEMTLPFPPIVKLTELRGDAPLIGALAIAGEKSAAPRVTGATGQ